MDPHGAPRPAGQEQGPHQGLRADGGRAVRGAADEFEIQIPPGKHLGDLVVEARGSDQGLRRPVLIEDLELPPAAGGIVGVIGPNGAGKTTLFRMIIGQEQPDAASCASAHGRAGLRRSEPRRAGSRQVGVRGDLRRARQPRDGRPQDQRRAYVNAVQLPRPDQEKKVGNLSGGERNRVHLAKLLRRGSNVLLLDEPTNDLDVDTLRALEEAILNYAGCVVVISHDRWFLDRIATHILAFEGDGYVHWCEGNFQTYEQQRQERLGIAPMCAVRVSAYSLDSACIFRCK
jgi:energy-dependent translational throttle protein EttA